MWYSCFPLGVGLILSGYIFYANDFRKPAVWIAFYAAIVKNMWGFIITVVISGLAFGIGCKFLWFIFFMFSNWNVFFLNFEGIIRDFLNQPIYRTLGRLTYCAFLIHVTLIRFNFGIYRQPIYNSDITIVSVISNL